jgi:hypothetical protein
MTITIAGTIFDHHHYAARGDVPYAEHLAADALQPMLAAA